MKNFAFASDAAEREYKEFPDEIQDDFGLNLMLIQLDQDPKLPIKHLNSVGPGVIELIINGSPAFRCLYITKYQDTVFVLHSFEKTTNGNDVKAMRLAGKRLQALKLELGV